eukprot:TRINITY_DN201_c0_g1_i1.p2 TRINITY_DN201_c0_g1~~TRINITY_DN201_c0_g1_i1.p2  ORF type:complete len:119 (-),score=11.35 TRINITY_DN201_c0_g1_i1:208-564(-)
MSEQRRVPVPENPAVTASHSSRTMLEWPFHWAYSLNCYETVTGLNTFVLRCATGLFSPILGITSLKNQNFVEENIRLTRYRGFNDKDIQAHHAFLCVHLQISDRMIMYRIREPRMPSH